MAETTTKYRSVSERGHAKFLESFDKLIAFNQTLDAARLNAPADLTGASFEALRTQAANEHAQIGISKADWRTAAQERQKAAELLDSRAAQTVALLEARGARPEVVEDARFYVRKLRGDRTKPLAKDDPETIDFDESETTISNSQQSNAARIATFGELIDFLSVQPVYEGVINYGLTIAELRTFAAALDTKHRASITAGTAYGSDIADRNGTFYTNEDSILNRAKRYKKLVFAVYGGDSDEYKTVNGISFQSPNR